MSPFKKVTAIILTTVPLLLITLAYYLNQRTQEKLDQNKEELSGVFVCEKNGELYEMRIALDGSFTTRGDSLLCDTGYLIAMASLSPEYSIHCKDDGLIGMANIEKTSKRDIILNVFGAKLVLKKSLMRGFNTVSRRIDKRETKKYFLSNSDSYKGFINAKNYIKNEDSLNYFGGWSIKPSVKEAARLILLDSLNPMDNETTFAILDSINSTSKSTRDYYYSVFLNIINKSDGALSEVMGHHVLEYFGEFPEEFFQRHNSKDTNRINDFEYLLYYAQYELGFLDNMEDSIKSSVNIANQYSKKFKTSTTIFKKKILETEVAR